MIQKLSLRLGNALLIVSAGMALVFAACTNPAGDVPAVARLRWFTHDFMKAEVRQDKLILSDLRMGVEPTYIFSFAVATRGNPHWHAIMPERYRISIRSRNLMQFWDRIWHQPR